MNESDFDSMKTILDEAIEYRDGLSLGSVLDVLEKVLTLGTSPIQATILLKVIFDED